MNKQTDSKILTSSGLWVATPWDCSSARWIRFNSDDKSECCFGYGQTVYAVIKFEFELTAENTLTIKYLNSPPLLEGSYFKGFTPSQSNEIKEINFQLEEEIFTGTKNITGAEFKYFWNLKLSDSPFPDELKFPYEVPLTFYGHREC
ncbi:MAG: hypothetical protein LH614_00455 [Pyrinomonadaceae bacterium]|nr:hypothetical protein [Pyrinomonadaceae bacterium]